MTARPSQFGIGTRLIAAFGGVGALSVIACMVGWLSYEWLSDNLDSINRIHLPAAAQAAELAEQGGAIIATAPVLALARSPEEHDAARKGLDERLAAMRSVLGEIDRGPAGRLQKLPLAPTVTAIAANLDALGGMVKTRIGYENRNRVLVAELRWLQADLMDEIEPLIEDARFVIRAGLAKNGNGAANVAPEEVSRGETMTSIGAQANLAIGLLNRVATITTLDDLVQTTHFLDETADTIEHHLSTLDAASDTLTLRQIVQRLGELSRLERGIPGLRRAEIQAGEAARRLLAENRTLVAALDTLITAHVREANAAAAQAADRSALAIAIGRWLLIGVALTSVVAAGLIGLLYVQRSLVRRIKVIAGAARGIARGDLDQRIALDGDDELTDMAHALERFRDTQQELVQTAKLAALGGLSAGIGHELNQPLAAIRAHAHNGRLLIDRGRLDDAGNAFARIQTLTSRMADIITLLKRFARKPDTTLGPVPLAPVIADALSLFGSRFRDEEIALAVEIPTDLVAQAEEVRLEQVFVNLIGNAIDALDGREERRLTLSASREGEDLLVHVSDTGSGIDPAFREAIFHPFFTTKVIGRGLGLGLSMSYNITRDFGGHLSLASTGVQGTRFTLRLKAAL